MCRKGRKESPKGDFFYMLSLQPIDFFRHYGFPRTNYFFFINNLFFYYKFVSMFVI